MDEARRHFVGGVAGAGALAALGIRHAGAQAEPAGTIPVESVKAEKAKAMQWHSERPLTGSAPAHEHDFEVTPNDRMFVRNNLLIPEIDFKAHRIKITGLVNNELEFSMDELYKSFQGITLQGMLECAGSGRSAYLPRASGTPWLETGGMGCPRWSGVRLRDVLAAAGVKPGGAHVAGQGGDPGMVASAAPVIRSIPLAKAMEPNTLVAWAMNGEPLPRVHGYPLRLVVPGWVGSASTKWLHTLTVLDAPFKGTYMTSSYVMPKEPVEPGQKLPAETLSAEAWPVKSIITSPAPNARLKAGAQATLRGRAWVGEGELERVEVSLDEGKSWQRAQLWRNEGGKYAWRRFTYDFTPARAGYTTLVARAWDAAGNVQPAIPAWNPLGYFWNGWHRVGVVVEA
ncbi:MAG TPA: sulfite oxidase [Burkholderiales bacterium]|nr:sulfite oxidase [Burkholderiales bacterium]